MRYIGYGLLIVLIMSGCVRRIRHIPIETTPPVVAPTIDQNNTKKPTGRLYTQRTEAKYNLKSEPFSIDSNKTDPELLGPQTTIKREIKKEPEAIVATTDTAIKTESPETIEPQPAIETVKAATPAYSTSTNNATSMTRSECISMIGSDKFERYSKRFGGDSGAIKRCAILKRLKGR